MQSSSFRRALCAAPACGLCLLLIGPISPTAAAQRRAPSQAVVAAKLASEIAGARTPAARYRALLAVVKAMHVGVYTGKGKPIARGAERSVNDMYVYDFTLRLVAGRAPAKGAEKASALARMLQGAVAPMKPRHALTADALRSALRAAVSAARGHPRDGRSFVPLLLWQLGKRTVRQDLTKPPSAGKMRFDSVQTFVLTADLGAYVTTLSWKGGKRTAARSLRAGPASLCGEFRPWYEAYETAKTFGKLFGGWGAVGKVVIDKVQETLTKGALSAYLIDQLVSVEATTADEQATHYGPSPHQGGEGGLASSGGKHLRFGIRVKATAKYGDLVAECGYLKGMNLPKDGVTRGLPVTWEEPFVKLGHAEWRLDHNSQIVREDSKTDEEGNASGEYSPNEEPLMGVGEEHTVGSGWQEAKVNLQAFFGGDAFDWKNPFSPNFFALLPPKVIKFGFAIYAHVPSGYEIARTGPFVWSQRMPYDYDNLWVTGHVCGQDPFAKPWRFTGEFKAPDVNRTLGQGIVFGAVNRTIPFEAAYRNGVGWAIQAKLVQATATKAAYMHIENMPASMLPPGRNRTLPAGGINVTITDDHKDCTEDGKERDPKPPVAKFDAQPSTSSPRTWSFSDTSSPAWGEQSRSWNFGDPASGAANNSTAAYAEHSFSKAGTYTVTLQIADTVGQTALVRKTVTVQGDQPPVAKFAAYPTGDLLVLFSDDSTDDVGLVSHTWDFGDGTTSTEAVPEHRYAKDGTYTVKLTVTDTIGQKSTDSHAVAVPADKPPVPDFSFSPEIPTSADTVDFFDASSDPDGSIESWAWDFGDGATSTEVSPSHQFAAGTWTVRLTVTDGAGVSQSKSVQITVEP